MSNEKEMQVLKRNGTYENVEFDKILNRCKSIGNEIQVNYTTLVMKVIEQLRNNITTEEVDELLSNQCASMSTTHPSYGILAGRISISNHHKKTNGTFSEKMHQLYTFTTKQGIHRPMLSQTVAEFIEENATEIDSMIDYQRDYLIDYFGFKTLERSYLMHISGKIIERPQDMWMRVACGIHSIPSETTKFWTTEMRLLHIHETYDLLSTKYFTHATPTLFNAGTNHPQMSSCYLMGMQDDSIEGIYKTLEDCAKISKWAGGIGLHIHNIRGEGTPIHGTNGVSNGIIPMLQVFNSTARYVDQCLHPNTLIYTTDGPKEIKYCEELSTNVFNISGDSEPITQVLEHSYTGPMLSITTEHNKTPMQITPEHPIFIQRIGTGKKDIYCVSAKELDIGDKIAYSIPRFEDNESNKHITEDDCFFYGLLVKHGKFSKMLSDGIVSISNIFTCPYIPFILTYMRNHYINYKENDKTTNKYSIQIQVSTNFPFRFSDFHGRDVDSFIIGKRWLQLPAYKSKHILKGIYYNYSFFTIDFITEQLRYLFLQQGILLNEDDIRSLPITIDIYNLIGVDGITKVIEHESICSVTYVEYDGYLLTPITNIATLQYNGVVYDLQMPTIHNYLTQYGLVHNGGGKRKGSIAIYLEPWHSDIESFLQLRKNQGDEKMKTRDLFMGLWIPDLFMERVKENKQWTLMCPHECPNLADVHSSEFVTLYERYEAEGRGKKTMLARELWEKILEAQMETSLPYILFKDSANRKSNQQNLGTIKSSNLCTEIIQYSDPTETAVCNLASIALPSFMSLDSITKKWTFDFEKLHHIAGVCTINLNQIIDINFYPTEKTLKSNMRHRPIGIGIQGMADIFMMLRIPFDSEEARKLNRDIFETIYHGALVKSCELAIEVGAYETFTGSPASKGILQFDMWNVDAQLKGRYNWDELKERIKKHGLRNSLLIAPMPTASTSQIFGFTECFEPITSNIYSRNTLAGNFVVVNQYLQEELLQLGKWDEEHKRSIIANNGSIQQLPDIDDSIKMIYRTVWEIPMKSIIDMSVDRGAYICQSQSLNLWQKEPKKATLNSMHFYSYDKGLKTGCYYLRRRATQQAQQFVVEPEKKVHTTTSTIIEDDEEDEKICTTCSA